MKQRRAPNPVIDPLPLWTELAMKTGDTMRASAQVLGDRTTRIATTGVRPSASDRREFALMGRETLEASIESAQAVIAQMIRASPQLGARGVTRPAASASQFSGSTARIAEKALQSMHARARANVRRLGKRKPGTSSS